MRIRGQDAHSRRDYDHWAFVPAPLPRHVNLIPATYKIVSEAERAIGRLDGAADRLPNPLLLVRSAIRKEAVSTSALEGTHAALTEVLEGDYIEESKRSAEVREILNYVEATERGLQLIKRLPVSRTLAEKLQGILVRGTRSEGYDAGQLRQKQVYIGPGQGIEHSRFVPPPNGDLLVEGLSDWEKWINAEDETPLLVKVALGHYQFECLHPFSDGNGRIGRLLATLQLVDAGALRHPLLNISPWLEQRRSEYQDRLLAVSQVGDYDSWVRFFCTAIRDQASDAVERIRRLVDIRDAMEAQLREDGAKGTALDLVSDLLGYPVLSVGQAAKLHSVTFPAANNAIRRLIKLGILREATGRSYGRIFLCDRIIEEVERL